MDIKKLTQFVEKLNSLMSNKPEEGYNLFKEIWPTLEDDERKILKPFLAGFSMEKTALNFISIEVTLYWLAIINFSENEVINGETLADDIFPKLVIAEGVNGNQITKLFYDLREAGYIKGSYEQIAEAISIIFPIEYRTAYNDLTEEKRRIKIIGLKL